MRVSSLGDDEAKAQRVADLSFRDALRQLGEVASIHQHAIKHVQLEDRRSTYTLETPRVLLPPATGQRKKRVARHKGDRRLMLVVGPEISRADMMERRKAAREAPSVQELQQEHDDLISRADALEREAKAIRDDAAAAKGAIEHEIANLVGPLKAYTETYDFQCDEATFAKFQELTEAEAAQRLLAATGDDDGLREIERGSWGDSNAGLGLDFCRPYPTRADGAGWTKIGSPEWLSELFPDWPREAAP